MGRLRKGYAKTAWRAVSCIMPLSPVRLTNAKRQRAARSKAGLIGPLAFHAATLLQTQSIAPDSRGLIQLAIRSLAA